MFCSPGSLQVKIEMFDCPACQSVILVYSIHQVRSHLHRHKLLGQLKHPIECNQNGCKTKLSRVETFVVHFNRVHAGDIDAMTSSASELHEEEIANGEGTYADSDRIESENWAEVSREELLRDAMTRIRTKMRGVKEAFELHVSNLVLELFGNPVIPYSIALKSIAMVKSVVELIVLETTRIFKEEEAESVIPGVGGIISDFEGLLHFFREVNSYYKVKKLMERHPYFVKPSQVVLGYRDELRYNTASLSAPFPLVKRIPNYAYYVSVEETVLSLCSNSYFLERIVCQRQMDTTGAVIQSFQDGTKCSDLLRAFPDGNVLFLQLFYDGLSITNTQGFSRGLHDCGAFFFNFLNLDSSYNSHTSNVHLLSLCNSSDLKNADGMSTILNILVMELQKLARNGITIKIGETEHKFYVVLARVTGDNLALHQMFGLIESFNADYCCLWCYATRAEMQTVFKENSLQLRTRIAYDRDVEAVKNDGQSTHEHGVKRYCILNDLGYFHVTDNAINDCMHTLLTGAIPYVLGSVMYTISTVQRNFTPASVNNHFDAIFSNLYHDKKNKPQYLSEFSAPGKSLNPTQNAAQAWAFFRYAPLIFYNYVEHPYLSSVWQMFLLFQEIVDIILAPAFTDSLLQYLEYITDSFLKSFADCYKNTGANIIPKLHFLVHYPRMIKINGPPRNYWCMTFERANSVIKAPTKNSHNFTNPYLTMAFRKQYLELANVLSATFARDDVIIDTSYAIMRQDIMHVKNLPPSYKEQDSNYLSATSQVKVNGTTYKRNSLVLLEKQETGYKFGEIELIIIEDTRVPLFVVKTYKTKEFHDHCFLHVLEDAEGDGINAVTYADFLDYHPLDVLRFEGEPAVRLRYFVLGRD